MLVFVFGITPKRSLHNLVASHVDGRAVAVKYIGDVAALSRATFNCGCDNLVVESPFVPQLPLVLSVPVIHVQQQFAVMLANATVAPVFSYSLRGPPATA